MIFATLINLHQVREEQTEISEGFLHQKKVEGKLGNKKY